MDNKKVSLIQVPTPEQISPVKAFVAKALGLAPILNVLWDVIEVYPKDPTLTPLLGLAHYNQDYDPYNRLHAPLARVRGVIVDLKTGAIVCDSYGHTQSLPCNEPLTESSDGTISVSTEVTMYLNSFETAPEENAKTKMGTRDFDKSTTRLFLGYEGAMIRIFKWNNKVFFSTHRRIDASASDWGGRRKFSELYKELNGPDPASFFGDEPYSPYCYMMLIAHNEIRLATSTSDNRIIFIGMKKVWNETDYAKEGGPYAWTQEFKIKIPDGSEKSFAFSENNNHSLIIQPSVSVDIANKFLFPSRYANDMPESYTNARDNEMVVEYELEGNEVKDIYFKGSGSTTSDKLAGGDFIIIYTQSSEGETLVYRLESPAFEYRVDVTGNDPNLYHHFVVQMVNFTKADVEDLNDKYPHYVTENGEKMSLKEAKDRRTYWWSLFYDAVPPFYKDEVDKFYKKYVTDVNHIAKFIKDEYLNLLPKLNEEKSEERKRISPETQKRFDDIRRIATNIRVEGQSPLQTILNLLYQETGKSLYRMMTTVKNLDKLKLANQAALKSEVNK